MKLSSLDIRKQQFSRIVRGYDRDEVEAFLDMVSTQWQELVDDMRRSEEKIAEMQLKLDHYQKVEEALEEAVKGARLSGEKKIEAAETSATAILEKAESRAITITMSAEEDRLKIKRETAKYSLRQKEMLSKFRAFLTSELEMLSYHENTAIAEAAAETTARLTEVRILDDDFSEEIPDSADESETDTDLNDAAGASDSESVSSESPGKQNGSSDKKKKVVSSKKKSQNEDTAEEAKITTEDSEADEVDSDLEEAANLSHEDAESELSSDSVSGDSSDSTSYSRRRKPSWTVNTLLSPEESGNSGDDLGPDRKAEKPSGEMRAAQEEIDNLRKLLKDLE